MDVFFFFVLGAQKQENVFIFFLSTLFFFFFCSIQPTKGKKKGYIHIYHSFVTNMSLTFRLMDIMFGSWMNTNPVPGCSSGRFRMARFQWSSCPDGQLTVLTWSRGTSFVPDYSCEDKSIFLDRARGRVARHWSMAVEDTTHRPLVVEIPPWVHSCVLDKHPAEGNGPDVIYRGSRVGPPPPLPLPPVPLEEVVVAGGGPKNGFVTVDPCAVFLTLLAVCIFTISSLMKQKSVHTPRPMVRN